jgi:phytoene dehydrogenase-like protein
MARYDVVVIGAGLGGLTAGAILARERRKVLVIERNNSVGGAASSYKVGDLFVEGSLHETSDPHQFLDLKHEPLKRAGVLDAVVWSPSAALYEVRGGPVAAPLSLPARFADACEALVGRFPDARAAIEQFLYDAQQIAVRAAAPGANIFDGPFDGFGADWPLSLEQKLDQIFGDNDAVKCALCANLAYFHDDPRSLWWILFAVAQGSYLLNGAVYIKGGSQRLSSALARAIKQAGSDVVVRRSVSAIGPGADGEYIVTHVAKDGSDPQTIETPRIVSNAAPQTLASLLPDLDARILRDYYASLAPSISLFALTLGLSKPPRDSGLRSYSMQLLPPWMKSLRDYAQGTTLMANDPAGKMPPLAIVDYAAIDAGEPAPPYVLSIFGPDRLSNWDNGDVDAYRAKRERWQNAIIGYLDEHFPGLAEAVTATSFNTALSVRQYLNAPEGAMYGFAPSPFGASGTVALRSPRTPLHGIYLASAYANFGGYSGVIQGAARCADMILSEA